MALAVAILAGYAALTPARRIEFLLGAATRFGPDLEALGFNTVGYGCTTCIGNSGPLPPEVHKAVNDGKLVVSAVLSGSGGT